MKNITFTPPPPKTHTLFVVLSGISGGKDEALTSYLQNFFKEYGAVLAIQFANDPLYHDNELPEMEDMTFEYCFDRIDGAIKTASTETTTYTNVIFIAHSFSSVIAAYYLGANKLNETVRYTLVEIDNDSSGEALIYLDSMSEEQFKDKTMNPFGPEAISYMRTHNSADILKSLHINQMRIEAKDIGADHEFIDDGLKQVLATKIHEWLSSHRSLDKV